MGVAVLQLQNCLKNTPPNMKLPKPKPKPKRKPARSHHKRAELTRPEPTSHTKPQPNDDLVMGQVKLLKRGEQQLTQTTPSHQPQQNNTVNKQFRQSLPVTDKAGSLYAGASMLVAAPPPSSVPLPIFVTNKITAANHATSNLRKILGLDFL